jgi:hypothetical protein
MDQHKLVHLSVWGEVCHSGWAAVRKPIARGEVVQTGLHSNQVNKQSFSAKVRRRAVA